MWPEPGNSYSCCGSSSWFTGLPLKSVSGYQKAGGNFASASLREYSLSPRLTHRMVLKPQSSVMFFALPFVQHYLTLLLAPMGSMPPQHPVLHFWQVAVHGGRAAGWRAPGQIKSISNFFTPAWKIRKCLSWRVAGPGWVWWFLEQLRFCWLDVRTKIFTQYLQRKIPIFPCFVFLFSSRSKQGWGWADPGEKSNNYHL